MPLRLRRLLGEKKKTHKSPGTDQIPTNLIKVGNRTLRSEINILSNSIWNNKDLPEEWKESIIASIYKNGDKRDCSNCRGITLCKLRTLCSKKSSGLTFSKSWTGSYVTYSCHRNSNLIISTYLCIRGISVSSIHYNQSRRVYINQRH